VAAGALTVERVSGPLVGCAGGGGLAAWWASAVTALGGRRRRWSWPLVCLTVERVSRPMGACASGRSGSVVGVCGDSARRSQPAGRRWSQPLTCMTVESCLGPVVVSRPVAPVPVELPARGETPGPHGGLEACGTPDPGEGLGACRRLCQVEVWRLRWVPSRGDGAVGQGRARRWQHGRCCSFGQVGGSGCGLFGLALWPARCGLCVACRVASAGASVCAGAPSSESLPPSGPGAPGLRRLSIRPDGRAGRPFRSGRSSSRTPALGDGRGRVLLCAFASA